MKSGDWLKNLKVGGAVLALTCLVPACGPSDDDGTTPTPTPDESSPTDAPATATPSEVTPTPGGGGAFPDGDFIGISPWLFSFGSSAPYVMNAQALTASDGNGGISGLYLWIFWDTKASYQADDDPACIFIEDLAGPSDASGTNGDVDYDSCTFCSGFWATYQEYVDQEGCNQDYYDFWYLNAEGEEVLGFDQYMGFRDAEADGWPAEYADFSADLEEFGYVGSLYDQVAAETEGGFFPMFAISPYTPDARTSRPMIDLHEVEVGSAAQARSLLK